MEKLIKLIIISLQKINNFVYAKIKAAEIINELCRDDRKFTSFEPNQLKHQTHESVNELKARAISSLIDYQLQQV